MFTRYTLDANGEREGTAVNAEVTQKLDQLNYGGFVFLDVTYAELSVSIQKGNYKYSDIMDISVLDESSNISGRGWETIMGFSLMGKYPFALSETFSIFPMVGIEYQVSLLQTRTQADGFVYSRDDGLREKNKDGKALRLRDWNSFWIKLGCGVDFAITRAIFARTEVFYGFRFMTPYEIDGLEIAKKQTYDPSPDKTGLTSGPSVRLSAGYKFFTK
ncbi:autotransporter outer membrane beta-barrel domain-containing protein [Leadbettera azotonutricia]|uniref:Outer membrane protein beta-barrel domain-containing protein n=1 Tax=Leadbettera azotonutricia (strain ATCC BAA-888 / DSM 13862 / ZAS-9) TaxID=545695 RepID=F5Y7A2_LEAAZ|nr:autotransporter outer membrane beta-barrel domain-containing protein [Leadbettera azotonutricia]AEF80902.1 hypothetical protein TREAZ_3533 [Leadbettera azotonutricia ZAS-9]